MATTEEKNTTTSAVSFVVTLYRPLATDLSLDTLPKHVVALMQKVENFSDLRGARKKTVVQKVLATLLEERTEEMAFEPVENILLTNNVVQKLVGNLVDVLVQVDKRKIQIRPTDFVHILQKMQQDNKRPFWCCRRLF